MFNCLKSPLGNAALPSCFGSPDSSFLSFAWAWCLVFYSTLTTHQTSVSLKCGFCTYEAHILPSGLSFSQGESRGNFPLWQTHLPMLLGCLARLFVSWLLKDLKDPQAPQRFSDCHLLASLDFFFICLPSAPNQWLPSLSGHQNRLEGYTNIYCQPLPQSFWFSRVCDGAGESARLTRLRWCWAAEQRTTLWEALPQIIRQITV